MTKSPTKPVIYSVREIFKSDFNGITLNYIGSLPRGKTVFFYYGKCSDSRVLESVYISTLEAIENGYNVLYMPELYLSRGVEKAFLEIPRGSLFSFVPRGLENVRRSTLSHSLVTDGGTVSIVENRATFSYEALDGVRYIAASFADGIVICSHSGRRLPSFIPDALDMGKSVCVLRPALTSPAIRGLLREGAETVDSFSSFLSSPHAVAYPDEGGKYGTEGRRFSIMRI